MNDLYAIISAAAAAEIMISGHQHHHPRPRYSHHGPRHTGNRTDQQRGCIGGRLAACRLDSSCSGLRPASPRCPQRPRPLLSSTVEELKDFSKPEDSTRQSPRPEPVAQHIRPAGDTQDRWHQPTSASLGISMLGLQGG